MGDSDPKCEHRHGVGHKQPAVASGNVPADLKRIAPKVAGSPHHDALVRANSLSELADALSTQIMRPVTIADSNFGILAYSAQDLDVDRARVKTILRKHVPAEVVSALRKNGILEKLRMVLRPLQVEPIPELGLGYRVVIPLRLGEELLGHIWIIGRQETFPDGMTDFIEQAATLAVELLLRDQEAVQKRRTRVEAFLHDLFLGRFPTEEMAASQLRLVGITLSTPRVVLLISHGGHFPAAGGLVDALESAGAKFNNETLACASGNAIWALCALPPGTNDWQLRHQVTQLMQETMDHPSIRETPTPVSVGVGLPVASLLETKASFEQAAVALRWGACLQEHPRIMFSEDLGALRLIQLPPASSAPLRPSRALQVLTDYDQKKGADLLHSLEVYLDEAGNVRRAAARLHVHPNSLLYRLQRIQEVTRMDLDSGRVRLVLHLELKVQAIGRAEYQSLLNIK